MPNHVVYHTSGFTAFETYGEAHDCYVWFEDDIVESAWGILSLTPLVVHWSDTLGGLNFRQIRSLVLDVTHHFLGGEYKGTPYDRVETEGHSDTYTVYALPHEAHIVQDRIERLGYTVTTSD